MTVNKSGFFLGILAGGYDPSVAIVKDGKVIAYMEEERLARYKHANFFYPIRALKYCLQAANIALQDVEGFSVNINLGAYADGTMAQFYDRMRQDWDVDARTIGWQQSTLNRWREEPMREYHYSQWRPIFGDVDFPPLFYEPHHYVHAFQAVMQSPFERSICITLDGSGDHQCTVIWKHEGDEITLLKEIPMPHSLGWYYAAFTEYLGFEAYDGEYKVMGLSAYGTENPAIREKLDEVLSVAEDGITYCLNPKYIHYGQHTYSGRFTDSLPELLGQKPRLPDGEITDWHHDLAYEVQKKLEESVERLVLWAVKETGIRNVCIGGGVGLNIKMNSRLFQLDAVDDVFAHPLCSDSGAAAGTALTTCYRITGARPEPLRTLALGYEETDEDIEKALRLTQITYEKPADICEAAAEELAKGRVVGWFQGRMEAGPRALGQRSILADPRTEDMRDRVNAIIKFREYWRPFCPSMLAEAADRYFDAYTDAPFMIIAFDANENLRRDAPAIVHVDGTSRVQLVHKDVLPRYHSLLKAFEARTGVPVLLNTSFNIKGEPIVCTVYDALRTFWSTGLDVLVVGDYLIRKPELD